MYHLLNLSEQNLSLYKTYHYIRLGRARSIHSEYPCTGGDLPRKGDTLSGIGRVSSIPGGYPCTGRDVRGEGDTFYG